MFDEMFQLKISLEDTLSLSIISGDDQTDHELLLQCQIGKVSIENASKVVNTRAFHWKVQDDMLTADVGAHINLLLENGF